MHIETKCLHEGYKPGNGEPKALPIYQSTTYTYDSTEHIGQLFDLSADGHMYSRISNPTVAAVEQKIAALEGGVGAPPFETQVDARALAARAKELLQTRRPPTGEVLWLRAQGYSFAEIAQRCGVSESAARTLDFRTRHWLREQLQKDGAEL